LTPNTNILSQQCCTALQLQQYVHGTLPAQELQHVEHHFTSCLLCSDAIDALMDWNKTETQQLFNNKNPFEKEEEVVLKIVHKKNNVLKIASAILLLFGIGLGAKLMLTKTNNNKIVATHKQEIAKAELNNNQQTLPTIISIKEKITDKNTSITTEAVKAVNTGTVCVTDDAEKLRIKQFAAQKKEINTKNIAGESSTQAMPIVSADEMAAPIVLEKPAAKLKIAEVEEKVVVTEDKAVNKMAKKSLSIDATTPAGSPQMQGAMASNTTYIVDGIMQKNIGPITKEQIISAYQQRLFNKVIADGNILLANKNTGFENTIKYYVGMSYAEINDKQNALKLLKSIDAKNEFYKLAIQKIATMQ
jgi:hypothetical protein